MKLLLVASGVATNKDEAMGIFAYDQALALSAIGHDVCILALDYRGIHKWRKWGINCFTINNIKYVHVSAPIAFLPNAIQKSLGNKVAKKAFGEVLNYFGKPDIMHAHFFNIGEKVLEIKRIYGIPFVITEHTSILNKGLIKRDDLDRAILVYKDADERIAVSNSFKNKLEHETGLVFKVVHNTVDFNDFYLNKERSNGEFHFISVGNITKNKGHDIVIKAMEKVVNYLPNCTLSIIGDGPYRQECQAIIEQLKLNDNVHMLGQMSRHEISKQLANANAFVLASRSETFGVSYIEAMATGIPVIATKCGGPEDFVNEDNGIIVAKDDIEGVANAMIEMIDNIDRFNSKSIRSFVEENFSPKVIAGNLEEIYEQLITSLK